MINRVIILTTTLPETFGGRTKSLLQRARIFSRRGLQVEVLSINHNDNYQDVFRSYRRRGLVDSRIKLCNMFEDLAGYAADSSENVGCLLSGGGSAPGDLTAEDLPHALIKNELPTPSKVHYADGLGTDINYVDYRLGGEVDVRAIVNHSQIVTRLKYSDRRTGKLLYEEYLNSDLIPTLRFRSSQGKKLFAQFDEFGNLGTFASYKRFIAGYLQRRFRLGDVAICDARGVDYSLRLVTKSIKKIYVMHNPHLSDPLRLDSGIKRSFQTILREEGLRSNEVVVSLTEDQKNSVLSYVPALKDHLVVIGHVGRSVKLRDRAGEPPKRVGIIGRLDDQKNLGDAIRAFNIFLRDFPDYILDIFGKGSEEGSLVELVESLGIADSVLFHGFTEDVDRAFQSVCMTLNTSYYEGFPLSIIESISNGTPVASYPVNFGPTAILGGIAGRVSASRTPESLAEEMRNLIHSPLDPEKVQARAREFSEDDFFDKWLRVMGA